MGSAWAGTLLSHAAISAAASASDTALARELLAEMAAAGAGRRPPGRTKACERAVDWEGALDLLGEMKGAGLACDRFSYTSAIGALGRGGEWEKAVAVWGQMTVEGGRWTR